MHGKAKRSYKCHINRVLKREILSVTLPELEFPHRRPLACFTFSSRHKVGYEEMFFCPTLSLFRPSCRRHPCHPFYHLFTLSSSFEQIHSLGNLECSRPSVGKRRHFVNEPPNVGAVWRREGQWGQETPDCCVELSPLFFILNKRTKGVLILKTSFLIFIF